MTVTDDGVTPDTTAGAGRPGAPAGWRARLTGLARWRPVHQGGVTPRGVALAALVVAALAALVFGGLWAQEATSSSLALARDRDAVLVDAKQAAINLNTLDWRNVDAGLALWERSATGDVLAEFQQNRAQYAKAVADAKRSTTATAPDAAVSELDDRAGVARVLVAVDVTVTPDGQAPVVTRQRLQLEMTRTPSGWKVSRLSPVRSPTAPAGN